MPADEAFDLGLVSEIVPSGQLLARALEIGRTISTLPRSGTLHTKRRIVLERETVWRPLFEEEEEALRTAVLTQDYS